MPTRFLVLFCLSAAPAFAQTPERWDIPLDPRDWRLAAENRDGRLTERIYVAPGESEYFWNEKILIGHQRLAFSPDDYLTGFIEHLNEHCRPYKMKPLSRSRTRSSCSGRGTAASPDSNSNTAASSSPRTACTSLPMRPRPTVSQKPSGRPGWPCYARPN